MLGRLHLITDTRFGRDPVAMLPALLEAGVDVVQVRAKDLSDRDVHAISAKVVSLCDEHGASCIVDDRLDVALAVGAAGVHLGADDLPVGLARALAGPAFLIGATVREPAVATSAVADGASYLGAGPSYATSTKAGLPDPIGPAGVAAICAAVDVPVFAVGGIRADRVAPLLAAGVHGVAVVDAISGVPDPVAAVLDLRAALDAGTR